MNIADLKWIQGKELDLFVESFSNAARTVQIRGITKQEQIIGNHITSADRSLATSIIRITDIPIFLTARAAANSVSRGELYVKVSLRVDRVVVALLFAGYVTDAGAPIHPNGKIESSVEGPGNLRSITGTNPAVNTEISETVPTGARWNILSFNATLVTDVNAANRRVSIELDDGATTFYSEPTQNSHTASLTFQYTARQGASGLALFINRQTIALPAPTWLPAGSRIRTVTASIQAGDDWDAPQLLVEEWLEP